MFLLLLLLVMGDRLRLEYIVALFFVLVWCVCKLKILIGRVKIGNIIYS